MNGIFSTVNNLKEEAKFHRDFDDFDQAHQAIDKAIQALKPEYERVKDQTQPGIQAYKKDLIRQLADTYGIKGGLYRRQEKLEQSEEMYRAGLTFEQKLDEDSYCLSNSIVIPILQDPRNLEKQSGHINRALGTIQHQVTTTRADQWWAWADLGLFNLLTGHSDAALRAYEQYELTGARRQDYDSTISVLADLKASLSKISDPLTRHFDRAIEYLQSQRP